MRIGLLAPPWAPIPPSKYGGIELVVDELARGFVGAGHEVVLFATGDSTTDVERRFVLDEAEGMRIGMAVPELRHVLHGYDSLRDCDVIHDHTIAGPVMAAERGVPIPVATTLHGPFNEELRDLYARFAAQVPIICISHAQRAGAPEIPVARVIHHGVDPTTFPVGPGTGDADGPFVLFLGRMAYDKGAHRAITAARAAGARILLAAKMREAWEIQYFTEYVEPLLGPDAIYLGEVPHERKLELLGSASGLIFPIRWNEPFGLVMLEAMACGTPVLAYKEGAAPEVVEHEKTGFLCDDEDDLAQCIGRISEIDRSVCRDAVEGYFSTKRMVDEHLDLFTQMVGGV